MPDRQSTDHRVVDAITDEGVWVIVDDGANSCCHGDAWRRNAEDKVYKLGFRYVMESLKSKRFIYKCWPLNNAN